MFGTSGLLDYGSATLRFLDCAPTPSTLAQSKERKGSNFDILQPWPETLCLPLQTRRETGHNARGGGSFPSVCFGSSGCSLAFGRRRRYETALVAKGNGEVATNEAKIRVVGRLPTRLRNFADRTGELNLKILIASTNTRKNGPIVHKSSPNLSSATQSLHPTQVKARGPLALLALLIELRNKSEGFNRVLSVFNAPSSF